MPAHNPGRERAAAAARIEEWLRSRQTLLEHDKDQQSQRERDQIDGGGSHADSLSASRDVFKNAAEQRALCAGSFRARTLSLSGGREAAAGRVRARRQSFCERSDGGTLQRRLARARQRDYRAGRPPSDFGKHRETENVEFLSPRRRGQASVYIRRKNGTLTRLLGENHRGLQL